MNVSQKNVSVIALLAVVCISAFFNFYKIAGSEFMCVDEYLYYTGAKMGNSLRELVYNFDGVRTQGMFASHVSTLIKELPRYGRPGYYVLAALATFAMGESKTTAIFLSGIFSVLTVLLTYLLSDVLFRSRKISVIAALLLALNAGHVLYGRAAYQTPGAVFFLTTAFYLYAKGRVEPSRGLLYFRMSALSYGLSFSVHPSTAYLAPVFFLLETQRGLSLSKGASVAQKTARALKNSIAFFLLFAAMIVLWELPHFLVYSYFLMKGQISIHANYFQSLVLLNNIGSYLYELFLRSWHDQSAFRLEAGSFLFYPSFLKDSQGSLYAALVACAVFYGIAKWLRDVRDFKGLLLISWIGAVYILYSGVQIYRNFPAGYKELRMYTLIFPPICILFSVTFCDLLAFFRHRRIKRALVMAMLLLVTVLSAWHAYGVVDSQFSYRDINAFLRRNPGIDKVIINANTYSMGPFEKAIESLDGFLIADNFYVDKVDGKITFESGGSRLGVFYRDRGEFEKNRVFVEHRIGTIWPRDVKRLFKEGKARYLLSSPGDYDWFGKKCLTRTQPIFFIRSPFVCKARTYDVGIAPNMDAFHRNAYIQKVGIYDLKDIFGPGGELEE